MLKCPARLIFPVFFLFNALCSVFSSESLYGRKLSDYIKETVTAKGYNIRTISLSSQDGFPENIVVTFRRDREKNTSAAENQTDTRNQIRNVTFVFFQDFFQENQSFCMEFLKRTKDQKLPYNCSVLFCPDSQTFLLPGQFNIETGIENYASSIYEPALSCAIIVKDKKRLSQSIYTKSRTDIAPLWLVKSAANAFKSNNIKVSIKKTVQTNTNLDDFHSNGIAAICISSDASENDLEMLTSLEDQIKENRTTVWSRNYSFVPAGKFNIFINEAWQIVIYIIVSILIISSLAFAFLSNKSLNLASLKDIKRTWFFIPLYIFICSIFLTIFQRIFNFSGRNIILGFSLKIALTIFLMFFITAYHVAYKIRISVFANAFHKIIISSLTFFFFTNIYLSLTYVFLLIYLITYFSKNAKSTTMNIIYFLAMMLPYIFLLNSDYFTIMKFQEYSKSSFMKNLVLSFILTGFVLQWTRITLVSHLPEAIKNDRVLSKHLKIASLSLFATVIFSSIIFIPLKIRSKEKLENILSSYVPVTEKTDSDFIKTSVKDTKYMDLLSREITIGVPEGAVIARCLVTIKNPSSTPFYECNYEYNFSQQNEAVIKIPDWSSKDIRINYTTEPKNESTISISLYTKEDENRAFHYKKQIQLSGVVQ